MDLRTTYLGLPLENPLMPGASPLVDKLDVVKQLEDAGAGAIVMHSLFEEQIVREEAATRHQIEVHAESYAEALSYFPKMDEFRLCPEEYLSQLGRIKSAVRIPVIASLNGYTPGGWARYARLLETAGADAIELNIYFMAMNPKEGCVAVENRTLECLAAVKSSVKIPVAVKLSPFFSSVASMAHKLDEAGADGLVFFNRFYQPDIDVEKLEIESSLHLSDPSELTLRLRWLAVASGHVKASLAASGGVHSPVDAVKAIMAGAHAVQVVSALLQRGPGYLKELKDGLSRWLESHEYESVSQMRGSMNLTRCPEPAAYERANYIRILQGYKV